MKKYLFLLPIIFLVFYCKLPEISMELMPKKYSEKLVDDFLDKLNPEFSRDLPLYTNTHLLIMKTTIKGEFTGNGVSDSQEFNDLIPYLIHGAMITNSGFDFTLEEHILACSLIVKGGIDLCSDYEVILNEKDSAYNHITENSIGCITNSGIESVNLIDGVEVIIASIFNNGTELDKEELLKVSLLSLYKNEINDLNRLEIFNNLFSFFLYGAFAIEDGSLEKYESVKELLDSVTRFYGELDSEDKIQGLDKIELTCELINSAVLESKSIEGLGLSDPAMEEELIEIGVTRLLEYNASLLTEDIADSLSSMENIQMENSDILLLIN